MNEKEMKNEGVKELHKQREKDEEHRPPKIEVAESAPQHEVRADLRQPAGNEAQSSERNEQPDP